VSIAKVYFRNYKIARHADFLANPGPELKTKPALEQLIGMHSKAGKPIAL
jgi:hypothetical protein